MNSFNYKRRLSSVVEIGDTPLGGLYPIRIQSMANVSTMDTEAAVSQAVRMAAAGAEYIRFTAQGVREASNLGVIRHLLNDKGCRTPLVADIHFNPAAAEVAAVNVEKVRINPGNYATFSSENYAEGFEMLRQRFVAFLALCREHNTAIRIGVNHGSLSERIMNRYGDTPEGMVESCMEFLRICKEENFANVVISIKASNTVVMIRTVRLLVRTMDVEGLKFPLHLGVTEAGEGEDGRIKSALGIGTLLADGIGDTVRVSLSEEPEAELPVARKLVEYIMSRTNHPEIEGVTASGFDAVNPVRRKTRQVILPINGNTVIGGDEPPIVVPASVPENELKCINLTCSNLNSDIIRMLKTDKSAVVILSSKHINPVGEMRKFMHRLMIEDCDVPVILRRDYNETDLESLQIKAAADFGALLVDGFGDGIMLRNSGQFAPEILDEMMYSILQAARVRISKTEYISCPGCGRTLFNLQKTVADVKSATAGYKGLKIAIMGCIVNGPGEMVDADYGYVGAGYGRISLYKGKNCVLKNIPENEAVTKLLELIGK